MAPTIGISVDPRRANLSEESITINVARLKAYKERLILFPRRTGQIKKGDASKEDIETVKDASNLVSKKGALLPIVNVSKLEAVGEVSKDEMGEGTQDAYKTLRTARSDARLVGVREKRAKAKADEATAAKK